MLAMFIMASLVVPGVVAAQREPIAPPSTESVASEASAPGADDLQIEADPAVGMCFNRACTSHAQCRTWCNEPSAYCVPVNLPPHYKFCELP
jgi:hypothetical protein